MAESRNLFAPVFREYPRGHNVAAEAHTWPQLLHASSGVIRVETEQASWIVAPRRAVWIPPGCVHESWMLTDVHFRSLYLTPSNVWRHMKCKVIDVSPLLGELILAAQEFDPNKDMGTRGNLITHLSLDKDTPVPRAIEVAVIFFAFRSWAGCIISMSGFNLR